MTPPPIRCEIHDYIEIACTYRLSVLLKLDSQQEIEGIAFDTLTKADKTEYLVLLEKDSKNKIEVQLSKLLSMQALTDNPHFDIVNFQ